METAFSVYPATSQFDRAELCFLCECLHPKKQVLEYDANEPE